MKTDRIERIVEYSILGLLVAGLGVISAMNYHPANKKILDDYLYGKSSSDSVVDKIGSADESSFGEDSTSDKPNDTADNHTPAVISEPASNPSSKTETPADTPQTDLININLANLEQLQQLNGIGKVKAQAIIDYREAHGAFRTVDELTKVDGIGEKTLEKNRDRITVE
ncbi:MAG: ComEA family DNA-binding protein [Oscillospiraceae bacterium]|nr:ComEA family DNA-binding protein [Oscillospiraceae bacterium]